MNPINIRALNPKVYAIKDETHCPVNAYKIYAQMRPSDYSDPDSPYYLGINHKRKDDLNWFVRQPVGINKLGSIMKNMAKKANLNTTGLSNHSVRKTMATKLLQKGVETKLIKDLGGWRNINSLDSYATASNAQQREMSDFLQAGPSTANMDLHHAEPSTANILSSEDISVTRSKEDDEIITFKDLGVEVGGGKFLL